MLDLKRTIVQSSFFFLNKHVLYFMDPAGLWIKIFQTMVGGDQAKQVTRAGPYSHWNALARVPQHYTIYYNRHIVWTSKPTKRKQCPTSPNNQPPELRSNTSLFSAFCRFSESVSSTMRNMPKAVACRIALRQACASAWRASFRLMRALVPTATPEP